MSSNLIPLHLNTLSGDIVAAPNTSTTGTGTGYEHNQTVSQLTWVITHGGNTRRIICQVYDETDNLIIADSIQIVDANNILINFKTLAIGTAKVVFF